MNVRYLIPQRRRPVALVRRRPGYAFNHEIDRLFSDMLESFGMPTPWGRTELGLESVWPAVNVAETDKDVVVTAELPGLDSKDVTLELEDNVLSLSGEMKNESESEDEDRRWTRVERTSGSFRREIELPDEIDADKVKATFERGVLTVTLPKAEPVEDKRKVIAIE